MPVTFLILEKTSPLPFIVQCEARSQVLLRGGAVQRGDGPNEAEGANLYGGWGGGGGELWLSETELQAIFQLVN